ncbi:acetyl-CoA acetyltransferase [Rhodothalassium salexigens]|uniref:acetyl-CoA C-acyltransferase n=1 Tax=Rhodothalassium salexigens TaxID=1086 RepID=UPI001913F390|nr:acetyl-CoA C-acyltransferase [Rhodothalassium salexigens]MBK5919512.1 acetyl-CoA acetyltransferase [Rhodothalassium salexigens]
MSAATSAPRSASDPVVIVALSRTPMGGLMGELGAVKATELGATAIRGALGQIALDPAGIDETIMGCVLPAGQGQAPARQAAKAAGVPDSTGAVTINKMCGSGMKAVMQGADAIAAGSAAVVLAGGMESMTNAPFLMLDHRSGHKYGHTRVYDHMALDGLEDAYEPGRAMGTFAENTASHYQFTREAQDAYAIASVERARRAVDEGWFDAQITPVTVTTRKGDHRVERDEQPAKARPEKIPTLRPAFAKDGTVTAASSSSISDGAAALVLMARSEAERRGLAPIATLCGHATHAQAPEWFTTAPVGALRTLFERTGWQPSDVDLYEINEAFAVVPMAAMRELSLPHDVVNVHGGACALGHPIGASGARILVTLIHALKQAGARRGVASLCIGGGEATAMAVELAA